jgi:hypothetical protein
LLNPLDLSRLRQIVIELVSRLLTEGFVWVHIALAVSLAAVGAVVGVLTGGLGAFPIGAWASDIIAGATVGFGVGDARGGLFVGHTLKREEDADEIEDSRN